MPPIPKRLPGLNEPGLGYERAGRQRYFDTEVFIDDCFLADGTVVGFPARTYAAGGAGEAKEDDCPM